MSTVDSNIAARIGMEVPKPPIAGVGHIQNIGEHESLTAFDPMLVLPFDPTAFLGDNPDLSIKGWRHIARAQVNRGQPVVLNLSFESHENRDRKVNFSPMAAASIVGINILPNNGSSYWYYANYHQSYYRRPQAIVEFDVNGFRFPLCTGFGIIEALVGAKIGKDLRTAVGGKVLNTAATFSQLRSINLDISGYGRNSSKFDFTFKTLAGLKDRSLVNDTENLMNLVWGLFVGDGGIAAMKPARLDGIAKTYAALEQIANSLYQSHPLHYIAFRSWVNETRRALDGIKISAVFNDAFKGVVTAEKMVEILDPMVTKRDVDSAIKKTAIYKARRKVHLKTTTGRAFVKLIQDKK